MACGYMVSEPVSNSFWSKTNMVLTLTRPPMYFYMLCAFNSKSSLVASHLSCSTYSTFSSRTWFLCLALVREPTFVHSLPQLLIVPTHQHILALFSLSLHLAFFLLPFATSLLILSSSTFILPSVLVLLPAISVLLPASSTFLSSSTLLSVSSASFFFYCQICLHEDWIHFHSTTFFSLYYVNDFLFPWSCTRLLLSSIVARLSSMLVLTPFLWIVECPHIFANKLVLAQLLPQCCFQWSL